MATQNQNESLNGVLWMNCPKTKFHGRKKVLLAVCETICYFNSGSVHKASMIESFGLIVGRNSLAGFRKEDQNRIQNAERKISLVTRKARRKKRGERKSKGEKTKTTYHPGAFGLSVEPDVDIDVVKKSKKPKIQKPKSKKDSLTENVENIDTVSLVFVCDSTVVQIKGHEYD